MRGSSVARSLPHVVVMTADCSSRLRQRIEQANVARILLKPVRMDDIRGCAQRLIHADSTVQNRPVFNPSAALNHELRELFSQELTTRLPVLDVYISRLDWKPASEILHQLIASSAMCRERELESYIRLLHRAINRNPGPKTIAQTYYPFLQAVSCTKMHL